MIEGEEEDLYNQTCGKGCQMEEILVFDNNWIFQDKKMFLSIDNVLHNNLIIHQFVYSNK
jgi:hypothetical protein